MVITGALVVGTSMVDAIKFDEFGEDPDVELAIINISYRLFGVSPVNII